MSLELQYFKCCKAGFRFTETEFRRMPSSRRYDYMLIANEYHKQQTEEQDKIRR